MLWLAEIYYAGNLQPIPQVFYFPFLHGWGNAERIRTEHQVKSLEKACILLLFYRLDNEQRVRYEQLEKKKITLWLQQRVTNKSSISVSQCLNFRVLLSQHLPCKSCINAVFLELQLSCLLEGKEKYRTRRAHTGYQSFRYVCLSKVASVSYCSLLTTATGFPS